MIGDPSEGVEPLLSVIELERALADLGLEAPVRFEETTGSTNATAVDLAEAGAPEWTLVAAGHQTAGRGRLGRTWTDRPEAALMFSFVLRPALDPEDAGLIPLLAGAAMAGAVRDVVGLEVRCKWPNDLLLEGGKVGGILAESSVVDHRIRYAVVGIGLNLEPPADVATAAGLGDADVAALLSAFLRRFHGGYVRLPEGAADDWTAVSATLGAEVEVARLVGPAVRGRAIAVDERGALVIRTASGMETVSSGEVEHVGNA
jgi:BirA family transcriptional regulator, biotin operon repressor / biotin---[acetyl-CoA-carboxylase] ligase